MKEGFILFLSISLQSSTLHEISALKKEVMEFYHNMNGGTQCECWIAQNVSLPAAQGRLLLGLTGGTTKALFRHRREGDLAVLNTLEAFHFSADETAAEVTLPHVVLPSHGELGALFTRKQRGLFRMVTQPRLGSRKRTVVRVTTG